MPEMDMWTVNYTAHLSTPGASVQRVSIVRAPGDRIDAAGTLWVDYPVVGGESVKLDIKVTGEPRYYHRNSLGFAGPGTPWVGASGVANVSSLSIPLTVKHLPDEMRFRVKSSDDDTEEQADGQVPPSSDLEFVQDESTQVVGLRFADVRLPGHRKIEAAHLQFTCDETSDAETAVTIAAVDETDAAPFTASARRLSTRVTLADAVEWKIPAWDKADRAAERNRSPTSRSNCTNRESGGLAAMHWPLSSAATANELPSHLTDRPTPLQNSCSASRQNLRRTCPRIPIPCG